MNDSTSPSRRWLMPAACFIAAFAGFFAALGIQSWRGLGGGEMVVRNYLLEHPEILPEAMERLRQREMAKQLVGVQDDIEKPFPGAVMGNPDGKVTLVEFMDFACGFCRQSEAEVSALIAANPDLKVVVRQLPILSPASEDAAKMALAAAEQGKYTAFHHAMYAAGKPDAQTIEAAARVAGVDLERARQAIADPRLNEELARNAGYARQLGFEGTPSWVIGDEVHSGAVGQKKLAESIAKARG
ncbi:MAG: DsbA family protein [Novosphingobium sp.]